MMPVLVRMLARRVVLHPPAPLRVTLLLAAVLLYGAAGFLYFELPEKPTLTWSDAFWYAIVTVTTVGYGDFACASVAGRFLVAMPMMFFGIGLLGYVLSLAASALIEAKNKEIRGMSEFGLRRHLVICNFPSLSAVEQLLDELRATPGFDLESGVILVDEDLQEIPEELQRREVRFVKGNPARDATLGRASIDHAAHAIILSKRPGDSHSDATTLAIALAIEARNPKVHTVAQCVDPASEELLRKARCNSVVCTARFDALFLTSELACPGVQEVLEELTRSAEGEQLYISAFEGKARPYQKVAGDCAAQGHLLIGIRREAKSLLNPAAKTEVRGGDQLVTIGRDPLRPITAERTPTA
jgi:voltage-gated potassium channel